MADLAGKNIILGVSGGIAAYKAAELTRLLTGAGASVQVVMTRAATAFVAPLTFQALSGHPVQTQLLDPAGESAMDHIHLARWADLVLVAPATADCIARLRAGLADDLLTTLCLAAIAPLALAPAMNQAMWSHPATRENIAVLAQRGARILGPAEGSQACGETGPGRLLEPAAIVAAVAGFWPKTELAGCTVLISAGPTREPLDPVRYISNRSSGKMGYALAEAALALGARVILVSGPTSLAAPAGVERVPVETADEMYRAVLEEAGTADIFIGAAAVADYTPAAVAPRKIKKGSETMQLALCRTRDILAAVAALRPRPYTVGFAAETDDMEAHARQKLKAKSLDLVAGNRVGPGLGFETDDNALFVCWPDGETHWPEATKQVLADRLLRLIAERYHAAHRTD